MRTFVLSSCLVALVALPVTGCSSSSTDNVFGQSDGGTSSNSDGSVGNFNNGDDSSAPAACTPTPGSYDIPGDGCDNDGDGAIDNVPSCDTGLVVTGDATAFAKSIGL